MFTLGALILFQATSQVQAEYRFTVKTEPQARVECEARFKHLPPEVEFNLPDQFAYKNLKEPRLLGPVTLVHSSGKLTQTSPYTWLLREPGSEATLQWTVPLDHRTLPELERAQNEYPYLAEDHGMLVTATLAIAPSNIADSDIQVHFEVPPEWPLFVPWLGSPPNGYRPSSWAALQNDLIAVGAWSITRQMAAGVEVTVAFAPNQDELQASVAEKIAPIIEAEVGLFGMVPNSRYLFLFGHSPLHGLGGSPKTSSMTLFVEPSLPTEFVANAVVHLIAHEYHHTWMQAQQFGLSGMRFFAEGFTDWYAYFVSWQLGYLTDDEFVQNLATKLAEYEHGQSDSKLSLLDAGGPQFFEGGGAYTTVYAGGLAMAALCDLSIRKFSEGKTLAHLMRDFYNRPSVAEGEEPGLEDFLNLLQNYTTPEFSRQIRTYLEQDQPVNLSSAFQDLGVAVSREEVKDGRSLRANMNGNMLLGVDPNGLAGRLGLQSGDRILGIAGNPTSSERDVRKAWRTHLSDPVVMQVKRAGEDAPESLRLPLPITVKYKVPGNLLDTLRSGY